MSCPGWTQILLNPPPPPDVIRVDVELVNVLCSVRDKRGGYVTGLRQEDFELRVDGRLRPITHFAAEVASPLTVAPLLDVSGSVAAVIPEEKAAAARFFERVLRPGDRAMLAGFAELIAVWQDLTPQVPDVEAALDRARPFDDPPPHRQLETHPRGGTLLYDAVALVAGRKLKPLGGRKTIVLITDGDDVGSIATDAKAIQAAQEADAVIYGIRYLDPAFAARRAGRIFDTGLDALTRLSEPTGGRTFDAMRKQGLDAAFDEIGEEMRHQYGLGFTPEGPAGRHEFHKLEVRLRRNGLKARARSGYYR
jgi:VWFA-related protein